MDISSIYYDPYRPQGFGDGLNGLILNQLASYAARQMGGQLNLPSGYSNSASLWSRMATDRYHQQAMALAGQQTRDQVGNLLQLLPAMAQTAGGKQFTLQQQEAFRSFAERVSPFVYSLGMQSQFGSQVVDALAGGYNPANTLSAYTQLRKTMLDPVTRGSMKFEGIKATSDALFEEMYGGTALERRQRSSGFLPGEMKLFTAYLARQGRLGGMGDMQAAMDNPLMAATMRSGVFSDDDLKAMGMGVYKDLDGKDLSDPKVQEMYYKVNAAKQRGELSAVGKMGAAVKDMLLDSGLSADVESILQTLGTFTEKYSTQLSGTRTTALLRQSHEALKDFKYGAEELLQLQDIAGQTAGQYGYEEGFTPVLARNQNVFLGSILGNQRMAGSSYGKGNAMQQAQMRSRIEAGFGKSTKGNTLAAIALLAQDHEINENTPAGKRLKAILTDINGSNYIGDQEFVSMSPEQQVEMIASGFGLSTNRVFQTMSNELPLEAITADKNLTRFAGQFAADDLGGALKSSAIAGLAGEFAGLDASQASDFLDVLGDAAVENVRSNVMLDDRAMMSKTSAGLMLQHIKQRAAGGDKKAQAFLDHLAKAGSPEEQFKMMQKYASYANQEIEGEYGALTNINMQMGRRTEADFGAASVKTNMGALKKELLTQTSLADMKDLLMTLAGQAADLGGQATEEDLKGKDILDMIGGAVGSQLTDENESAVMEALRELNELKKQKDAAAEEYAKDPSNQAAADAAKQYSAALDEQIQEIMDNTGLKVVSEEEASGITFDENGNVVRKAVPKEVAGGAGSMQVNLNGLTIQFGDDAIIQIKDALVRSERGTVDTIGKQ